MTQQLILLSPCAFIAQDYYILPHLAESIGAHDYLLLRARVIGQIFITSDCITFLVQLAGSGMPASASLAKTGETVSLHSAWLSAQLMSDCTHRIDCPAHLVLPLYGSVGLLWIQCVSSFTRSTSQRLTWLAAESSPKNGLMAAQCRQLVDFTTGDRFTGLLDGLRLVFL